MAKSDGRGAPGGTGMLLLALLERRDMYGYEMVEALRAQSKEIFHLKAGTLYTGCLFQRRCFVYLAQTYFPGSRSDLHRGCGRRLPGKTSV